MVKLKKHKLNKFKRLSNSAVYIREALLTKNQKVLFAVATTHISGAPFKNFDQLSDKIIKLEEGIGDEKIIVYEWNKHLFDKVNPKNISWYKF